MLNLVNNAIKFTDHGDISVTVTCLDRSARRACASMSPTPGTGISRENLALLFQPFRQIDAGLTRHREGTGLGLAICRRLCVLLGGTIEVQSQPGLAASSPSCCR